MPESNTKVIRVRSPLALTGDGHIDSDIIYQMMESGLKALFDDEDYLQHLETLFADDDVIGMKVNTLGGRGISTNAELVGQFCGILSDAGIPAKRQLVWDRSDRELKTVGYSIKTSGGPLCFGTDHPGIGYSNRLVSKGKIGGLLSRILTEYCGGIVNMSVLKDHGIAGITCSLKNHFGSIHNPNKYHDNGCDPYVADLNSLEQIRSKGRLIIVDCLRVQYHGGPSYQPRWAATYGGILLGFDPVAIDTIGYGMIEELRKKGGKEPLKGSKREPIYIKRSAGYGLGEGNEEKIDLRDIVV